MPDVLRCNVCQGEYAAVGLDGARYFHVCPPITRAQVVRDKATIVVDRTDVLPTDTFVQLVTVPRPGGRDENVDPTKRDAQNRPLAKADGAGATKLT